MTVPDLLSVVLRALSFISALQAAGAVLFIALFAKLTAGEFDGVRILGRNTALAGVVFVIAHGSLEAARMAGDLSGVFDLSLQRIALGSALAVMLSERVLGLTIVALCIRGNSPTSGLCSIFGAVMVAFSFGSIGHTAVHPARWLLEPALAIHVLIVSFWFGALAPLYLIALRQPPESAARIISAFSATASWFVPGLFVAGLVLALTLVPRPAVLLTPYGMLLCAKVAAFALLMLLAAGNKWRFGPRMEKGDAVAARAFRRSVVAEAFIIVVVLGMTTVMTSLFSPD